MSRKKYSGWGLFIETRPSKDVSWDEADVDPVDFFSNKKEAEVAKSKYTRTDLMRPAVYPQPVE